MIAFRTYRLRAAWEFAAIGPAIGVIAPIQVLFAGSFAVGLGLLIPNLTPDIARYLSTGAPTVALLVTTVTVIPQEIARRRDSGAHDFMRTLPGPRTAHLAGLLTPQLVINLPGALIAVAFAGWYFDFDINAGPMVVPALMFVSLTGAAIGVAIAYASPNSAVTVALAQMAIFFVLLYSPINYPATRLPDWLQQAHSVLPFESMATIVRSSLTSQAIPAKSAVLAAAWALGSFAVAARAASRRP